MTVRHLLCRVRLPGQFYLSNFIFQNVAQRRGGILHPKCLGKLHHGGRMLLAELPTILVTSFATAG